MKKQIKAYLELLLRDYPHLEEYKNEREFELRHPVPPIDENVGGGKAKFKKDDKVERMLITIEEDRRLNILQREHDIIKKCYSEADPIVQTIIREIYFKDTDKTIQILVDSNKIGCSRATAYMMYNSFLKNLAGHLWLHDTGKNK